MKPIRYASTNGALYIGGQYNKLTVFTRERLARLKIGRYTFHFGNW